MKNYIKIFLFIILDIDFHIVKNMSITFHKANRYIKDYDICKYLTHSCC